MKKLAAVLTALFLAFALAGCNSNSTESKIDDGTPSRFVKVEQTGTWMVVYDNETKVMYSVSYGVYNIGTFTVLVNADGTPLLYEE